MSFFAVTIEHIASIRPHSNADRLLVASLEGLSYQFVIAKDLWNLGDRCLYFPLDAVMPQELLVKMNLEGRLAGAKKNRVKTIKLRGEISQGLIGPLSLLDGLAESEWTPEGITKFLGVTKYEPEIDLPQAMDAHLVDLPDGVGIYDVENCERYPGTLAKLMDLPVHITEKLEGTNYGFAIVEGKEWVCQRRFAIEPVPDKPLHYFLEHTEKLGISEFARKIAEATHARHLVMRGEVIGPNIQKNIYRLAERQIRFFDLMIDHRYLAAERMLELFAKFGLEHLLVPSLSLGKTLREWLGGKDIREMSTGQSVLHNTLREGIVIRPLAEQFDEDMGGRLILKQISPEYLAGAE